MNTQPVQHHPETHLSIVNSGRATIKEQILQEVLNTTYNHGKKDTPTTKELGSKIAFFK